MVAGVCAAAVPRSRRRRRRARRPSFGSAGTGPIAVPGSRAARRRPAPPRPARARRARSVDRRPRRPGRAASVAGRGALAVDMESAWLAAAADGRPLAVVRVVVETPGRELSTRAPPSPASRALAALRRATPRSTSGRRALRRRRILLAAPRSFCAGVDRAIEIVELALEQRGAPVYVRKQIVHNEHVVADLERRGAVFVEELDEVPDGRDRRLLGPRRLAGGADRCGRAAARRDRRHLPARQQGARRGAPLRRRTARRSSSSATPATRRSRARTARRPTRPRSSRTSQPRERSRSPIRSR